MRWGVIIAAGGSETGAFAAGMGTPHKPLATFGGRPSLAWVLDAVRDAGLADCVTVGSNLVEAAVDFGSFVSEGSGAVDNVLRGLDALPNSDAFLILPSDCPALQVEDIRRYCSWLSNSKPGEKWLSAGLTPFAEFQKLYPEIPTKALHFREGKFLSGAFFAADREGFFSASKLVTELRSHRKSPLAMASRAGLGNVLKFVARRLSLAEAPAITARLFGVETVLIDPNCHPSMAADFDDLVEFELLKERWPSFQ